MVVPINVRVGLTYAWPTGVAVDDKYLWASVSAQAGHPNALLKIDKTSNAILATINGTGELYGPVIDDDYAYAIYRSSGTISKINKETNQIVATVSGLNGGVGINGDGTGYNYDKFFAPHTVGNPNQSPIIESDSPSVVVNEGQPAGNTGTWSDADLADDVILTASVGSVFKLGNTWVWAHTPMDNKESGPVVVTATDGQGATSQTSFELTVNNLAPAIGDVVIPADPLAVNNSIAVSADFRDPGTLDSQTAVWDWGDGSTSAGLVEANGSGFINGSHAYAQAGVYTVKLTVTDNDGASGGFTAAQYVVVYDPSAGFVTGGGWINSPAGAYIDDPAVMGRANFGFVSEYHKGANIPTGQTQFQFKAGNLNLHSSSYNWLVVTGSKAMYKGEGNINGTEGYGFILSAVDGQIIGNTDTFRIKIWDKVSGEIVYDNQPGESAEADPVTTLGGGNIVIQK